MKSHDQLDSAIEIVTPENIAFRYEVAGPFRRMPAFLIDMAIRMAVFGIVVFCIYLLTISLAFFVGALPFFWASGFALILWFFLEWFYGGLFETFWNGQTPGKRMMGIRVLGATGRPVNGLQAMMRNVLRAADMMPLLPLTALIPEAGPFPIPLCFVGLAVPMINRRFQRLGDICCGTIVVIEDRNWLFGISKIEDPRAAKLAEYIPANFQIRKDLSRAIATYVERRKFFSPARRREVARHLAQPLLKEWNLPSDTSYDLLICALYHRAFIADRGEADEEDILQTIGESPFARTGDPFAALNAPAEPELAGGQGGPAPLRLDTFKAESSVAQIREEVQGQIPSATLAAPTVPPSIPPPPPPNPPSPNR